MSAQRTVLRQALSIKINAFARLFSVRLQTPVAASVAAALVLALSPAVAQADANAIRGPNLGRSLAFDFGWPDASRVLWMRPWLGVTQEVRVPYDAFGLGVATRVTLAGRPRGWGLEAQFSAGFLATVLLPGMAITASASTQLRWRSERLFFAMGTAVPAAWRLTPPNEWRVPVQGELWFAFRAGPFWFGATTAIGAALSPGQLGGMLMQGGLYAALPLPLGVETKIDR
jgi:hypothetical protein